MRRRFWIIIVVFMLCFSLVGCGGVNSSESGGNTEPSETILSPSTTPDPPAEPSSSAPTQTKPPEEDTVLDVSEISLSDLTDSYILLVANGQGSYLYRIYDTSRFASPSARIEFYHVTDITGEFLAGGAVGVVSALSNSINNYDYNIFANRFYYLHDEGHTEQLDAVADQWQPGVSVWILRTEDMACETTANEQDLEELMYLLYADRGTGTQHFGGVLPE